MSVKFDGSAGMKSFHSSSVEPTSTGTPAAEPRASDSLREPRLHLAVDDRLHRHAADLGVGDRARRRRERGLRLQDLRGARGAERVGAAARAELRRVVLGDLHRTLFGVGRAARAALRDRLLEQSARLGQAEQRAHAHAARGLAEDGHVLGIAAEGRDVLAHPGERRDLVEDALVAGRRDAPAGQLVKAQEAERAEPVVDRHHHDVAALRERRSVVEASARPSRS